MKALLNILLVVAATFSARAESFTILAQSGLNIRSEPSSTSEKIGSIPFGTVVEAEIDSEKSIEYPFRYKYATESIEGKQGFWIKIVYGTLQGYIFSGFGLVGEWVIKSTEINDDFRILNPGKSCSPINYDPNLHWYALVRSDGKLTISKTKILIRLIHEYNDQDTLGDNAYSWKERPIEISSSIQDSIFFFVGSRTPLNEKTIFSKILGKSWSYSDIAEYLYPEEVYRISYGNNKYEFHAYENVILSKRTS